MGALTHQYKRSSFFGGYVRWARESREVETLNAHVSIACKVRMSTGESLELIRHERNSVIFIYSSNSPSTHIYIYSKFSKWGTDHRHHWHLDVGTLPFLRCSQPRVWRALIGPLDMKVSHILDQQFLSFFFLSNAVEHFRAQEIRIRIHVENPTIVNCHIHFGVVICFTHVL